MRIVLAIALAACGSHKPETHHVDIRAMQFVPAEVVIHVGDTVVWTNDDVVPHTVTSERLFDSSEIAGKREWRYTFLARGELPYVCSYHPMMQGKVIVK
jgi:plastocyanin